MKLSKYSVLATAFLLSLLACKSEDEYVVSESGLKYRFVKNGEGPKPIDGDIVLFNITYISENEEVIFSTQTEGKAIPITFNSKNYTKNGSLEEVFGLIEKGDSLICLIPAEKVFKQTFNRPVPDSIATESIITFFIGVQEVLGNEDYKRLEFEKNLELVRKDLRLNPQMAVDIEKIDQYLDLQNISAKETESGVRYIFIKDGSGKNPELGEKVKVIYTGKILDGNYFDSNDSVKAREIGIYQEARAPYKPFEFILGYGEVIMGWDEVVPYLNKGSKARLYIPSPMAYGSRAVSDVIKENSILVFDVEVVDISRK